MDCAEIEPDEHVLVLSKTQEGTRFRPSNWIDRIAEVYADYPLHKRTLRFSPLLHPTLDDQHGRCLYADLSSLRKQAPKIYDYIIWFIKSNHLICVPVGLEKSHTKTGCPG